MEKKKLTESQQNLLDRMHSQTPHELTEEEKKRAEEFQQKLKEYEGKYMK